MYARVIDEHVPEALDVMADMVFRPALHRHRLRARGDPRGDRDVRGRSPGEGLRRPRRGGVRRAPARPGDHRPRRGRRRDPGEPRSPPSIDARYAPENVVIAAAGAVDHDAFVALVAERLGELPSGPGARRSRRRPRDPEPSRRFERKDTEQYHLPSAAPALSRHDERRFALRVLDTIFGGTSSSRLFQEVREKRGLAYAVYSFTGAYQDTGQVGLYVGTRTDNLARGDRDRRLPSSSACASEPATPEELTRAKENLKGRIVLALESTGARMNRLGLGGAGRGAAALARRGHRADRRGDPRRPAGAGRRAVGPGAALGGRDRPRAGGLR